jgi:hypothetical protein
MKKLFLAVLVVTGLSIFISAPAAISYDVSTSLPGPSGVDPTVLQVIPVLDANGRATGAWQSSTPVSGTSLGFGALSVLKTFPNPTPGGAAFKAFTQPGNGYFFSIDVGYLYSGTGVTINNISLTYADGQNPQASNRSLGWKTVATLVRKSLLADGTEKPEAVPGADLIGRFLLKDIGTGGRSVSISSLNGGWLRVYLGLVTLDPNDAVGWPSGAQNFTPGDVGGNYSGTLTIAGIS